MRHLPERLRSSSLLLRRYHPSDAAVVHEAVVESVAEVAPYESWCHEGYGREDAAEYAGWWDHAWEKGLAYYYAVTDETGGAYLGSCGLSPVEREHGTAGLGFWVRTSSTGQGVATDSARAVIEAGFGHLGLNRIELLIAVDTVSYTHLRAHET